jgi:hypothetical protein
MKTQFYFPLLLLTALLVACLPQQPVRLRSLNQGGLAVRSPLDERTDAITVLGHS